MWAIVTNRTLVWDYWNKKNCKKYIGYFDGNVCANANTVRDCDKVMERKGWVPYYRNWRSRIERPHELSYWATNLNNSRGKLFKKRGSKAGDEIHVAVDHVGVDNVENYRPGKFQTVIFPQTVGRRGELGEPNHREYFLHTDDARAKARDLYSLGADFLYGMLFRASFVIRKELVKETRPVSSADFSVGLHSRHSQSKNNGCDIREESRCLVRSLAKQSGNEACRVMIMSDRSCTISKLGEWLVDRNCTVETAKHSEGKSWRGEHGPFAGLGFFQDWVLVSKARSGFIGRDSTSSHLVRELIEYDRGMEEWHSGGDVKNLPAFQECKL